MNNNLCPIYVINLKRTPERKLHIQRQLDALNLSYNFVDAVDKYDLQSPTYLAEITRLLGVDKITNEDITRYDAYGHIACALSHIKVYNLMMKNKDKVACILEDDGIMSPDFPKILYVSQKIPSDMIMFSHQSMTMRQILATNPDIKKDVETFPDIDCSLFPRLRKIKWFRKLLPLPATSQAQLDLTSIRKIKWCFLMILSLSRTSNSLFSRSLLRFEGFERKFLNPNRRVPHRDQASRELSYIGCKIGGLPVRSSQQPLYGDYDIATPAEAPTAYMGYLITLAMAYRCKKTVDFKEIVKKHKHIDCIPWYLHQAYGARIRIVTPPCITASLVHLKNSTHEA